MRNFQYVTRSQKGYLYPDHDHSSPDLTWKCDLQMTTDNPWVGWVGYRRVALEELELIVKHEMIFQRVYASQA